MATHVEIRIVQNSCLYELLLINEKNKQAGIKVKGLSQSITRVKAAMTKEDIAWVEQQIAELNEDDL